jgi:multiple sugar transport system ATP-binding protein
LEGERVAAVKLDRVTKIYDGGVLAVDEISLEVADGEVLVLLGPSGCGKTTILRMIAGLEDVTSGDLWLGGQRVNDVPTQDRNIAMVFQNGALYQHLTVAENMAFPLELVGETDRSAIDTRVREMAHGLGLDQKLDRLPRRLSGGEQQRVAIGRALIRGEPTALLMDEPLASLDVSLRNEFRAEIGALVRSYHLTTIYVTHDQAEALSLADRIVVIRDGLIEDIGTPGRVYRDPATAFVAAFMGAPPINLVWATIWVENGERVIIDFGTQRLELPWAGSRSESLTLYHGQPIIVGIRPEALLPPRASRSGPQLHGKISSLEYGGHEWLARLDAGLRLVDVDEVRARSLPPDPPGTRTARPWYRDAGQAAGGRRESENLRGGHRSASLLVRLGAPHGWKIGREVSVLVDVPRIHLFDAGGRRIDAVPVQANGASAAY